MIKETKKDEAIKTFMFLDKILGSTIFLEIIPNFRNEK